MAKFLARRARQDKAKEGVRETMEVSELEVLKEIRGRAGRPARPQRVVAPPRTAQMWWGGFSSRKRARSGGAARGRGPLTPTRGPCRPEDCWSSGSSKTSVGLDCSLGADSRSRDPGAGGGAHTSRVRRAGTGYGGPAGAPRVAGPEDGGLSGPSASGVRSQGGGLPVGGAAIRQPPAQRPSGRRPP